MRYFEFMLDTTAKEIEKNATVNLREYAFNKPIGAVSSYLFGNLKNGVYCFMYREEQGAVLSAFSYDEKTRTFREAYDDILEMLRQIFGIKKVKAEPCEVTIRAERWKCRRWSFTTCIGGWRGRSVLISGKKRSYPKRIKKRIRCMTRA